MGEKNYNVIGVMSGTSLDGIDCAYAKIGLSSSKDDSIYPSFTSDIIVAKTIPYPKKWKEILSTAHLLSREDLDALNEDYTAYLAHVIKDFIKNNKLVDVDVVCSHGHTVLHQPDEGVTLQIGNLPEIAELIKHRVVCDFRVQDVEMGGQGAPLVPIGDQLLFGNYDYCLNLGGFANVSKDENGVRIAYDISPVNVVLNKYAQELGEEYDDGGAFAKAGTVHQLLLDKLNDILFYSLPAPKSLGIEWVHTHIFPLIEAVQLSPVDVLATFTEHVAIQLAAQFKEGATVLVTGGGAYNTYLLERVRFRESVKLVVPDAKLVEFKEALIFGLLGVLKLENLPNCLASVTGARQDHASGMLYES
jgi:anhydro-N-acetylmuramic acid kinase